MNDLKPNAVQATSPERFLRDLVLDAGSKFVSVQSAVDQYRAIGGTPDSLKAAAAQIGLAINPTNPLSLTWANAAHAQAAIAQRAREDADAVTQKAWELPSAAAPAVRPRPAATAPATPAYVPRRATHAAPLPPTYTDAELATRFHAITEHPLGKANPAMAMALMRAPGMSIEAAIDALAVAAGESMPTEIAATVARVRDSAKRAGVSR